MSRADWPRDLRAITEALELLFGPATTGVRYEQAGVIWSFLDVAGYEIATKREFGAVLRADYDDEGPFEPNYSPLDQ